MANSANMINKLVPISDFNKGQASKIFDRLGKEKSLVVLKNNSPSAVILSPEEYSRLVEIEENYMLYVEAQARMARTDQEYVSYEDALKQLGIDEEKLKVAEDVEVE